MSVCTSIAATSDVLGARKLDFFLGGGGICGHAAVSGYILFLGRRYPIWLIYNLTLVVFSVLEVPLVAVQH